MGIKLKSVTLNNSGQFYGAGTNTISGSFTVNSGSQRMLIVAYLGRGRDASSITYGGVNMTFYDSSNEFDGCQVNWFYLANPATGSNTLTANLTGASDNRDLLAIICLNNVDAVNPIVTNVKAQNTAGSVLTNINMTYDNTYVISANYNTGLASGNALSGAVMFADRDSGDSGGASYTAVTTASNLQVGFTSFNPGDTAYSFMAIEIKPAPFDGGAFLYHLI